MISLPNYQKSLSQMTYTQLKREAKRRENLMISYWSSTGNHQMMSKFHAHRKRLDLCLAEIKSRGDVPK